MALGSFCLVLHGHLPWVLHHGWWPHGEVWLYEAAAESWLPLLAVAQEGAAAGFRVPVTMGLMPVLLEQFAHPSFDVGFRRWMGEQRARARADEKEFAGRGETHLAWLAERWDQHFAALERQFDGIGGDIGGAFAALHRQGALELLTSNATHGYMRLLQHDACLRAQVRAGVASSRRAFGFQPAGAWLPECAYRPGGPWTPPVLGREARPRAGIEEIFAHEGVRHFFVDGRLFAGSRSEGLANAGSFTKVDWAQATWDTGRAWRSVLEAHGVSSDGGPARLTALARHPEVSEQVWSGEVGYPGDARYLEFHKRHGNDGLRYWRVTGPKVDLADKQPYVPDDVQASVFSHAQHFVATVRSILARHHATTGRHGVVVAPFDAELFGHWWHEGPRFIREVMLALHQSGDVRACTAAEHLAAHPADKVVSLPEGSWGAGGDHRVWLNDELRWLWEAEYRAEDRFLGCLDRLAWRERADVEAALKAAARELLLLQASDWWFVIHTRGAVDYGYRRFCEHLARFDRACTIAESRAAGRADTPIMRIELADMEAHDSCFPELRLQWWVDG